MIGQSIGHYKIIEKLGAGGMGEVYRAEDTTLGREVAIKVLPEAFTSDPERLVRFEREAKLLASLNHPHIAQIHALEQVDGQKLLVMELVDGETLAERISKGAVPLEEVLPMALQIAQALEAAHERGIVHRDLKPANIKLTPEGEVKVLDFGLAKPITDAASGDLTHSPTLTYSPTQAGVLLGTAAYMSPEQVRGQEVDKRSDIWAFGVVLWEMVTGRRLFDGETVSDMLAGVLKEEPPWEQLPANVPRPVERLLHRCLTRDPTERLHDIADARLEIKHALAEPERAPWETSERPMPSVRYRLRTAFWIVAGALFIGLVATGITWKLLRVRPSARAVPLRVSLNLPSEVTLWAPEVEDQSLALSPDGRWLVISAQEGETWRLYKRSLEHFQVHAIPGTEGAYHPFFSPDGQWLGFFADGYLKKVPLSGGPPEILTEIPSEAFGAAWGADGTLVFNLLARGLWQVSHQGGEAELLAEPDAARGEWDLCWPQFLPDGQAVLFTGFRGFLADTAQIGILDLATGDMKVLIENGSYARYLPTGHLIFGWRGRTYLVPFDVERREVTGPVVPVPEPIFYDPENGIPHLSFSENGTLTYVPGGGGPKHRLVSVDLTGEEMPLFEKEDHFTYPRFSPDGQHLAVTVSGTDGTHIWTVNLWTGALTKLTSEGTNMFPLWTPDGERVAFHSYRGGAPGIYWKRADGSAEAELLVAPEVPGDLLDLYTWTPDGKRLIYGRSEFGLMTRIWVKTVDGEGEPELFGTGEAGSCCATASPDGRWLAYVTGELELGNWQVSVQPLPAGGERHQISTDGGLKPIWSPDGRQIYYRNGDRIIAVAVDTSGTFRAEAPSVLFEGWFAEATYMTHPNFDLAPDGKSFVMIKADENWGRTTEVRVVLNWFEELRRLAPVRD